MKDEKPATVERRLRMTLMRYASTDCLGAIECGIAGQFLRSGLYLIATDKRASDAEREFCRLWLPVASQACREPFFAFLRPTAFRGDRTGLGDALIVASADACRVVKNRVYANAMTRPISYFYALYFWLGAELEAGTLVLTPGSAFDQCWSAVAAEMLKHEDLMDETEHACRKRGARYGKILREFGLFSAAQPVKEAA